MPADALVWLAAALAVAAVVLGVLAWRGVISWGWMAAAIAALLGLLFRTRSEPTALLPAPASDVTEPILHVVDEAAEAELAGIEQANEGDDRLARLAEINNGGRE